MLHRPGQLYANAVRVQHMVQNVRYSAGMHIIVRRGADETIPSFSLCLFLSLAPLCIVLPSKSLSCASLSSLAGCPRTRDNGGQRSGARKKLSHQIIFAHSAPTSSQRFPDLRSLHADTSRYALGTSSFAVRNNKDSPPVSKYAHLHQCLPPCTMMISGFFSLVKRR